MTFATKTSGNCALIYDFTFCSEVAYAVPSNLAQRPRFVLLTGDTSTTSSHQPVQSENIYCTRLEIEPGNLSVSVGSRLFRAASHSATNSMSAEENHDTVELNQFLLSNQTFRPWTNFSFSLRNCFLSTITQFHHVDLRMPD